MAEDAGKTDQVQKDRSATSGASSTSGSTASHTHPSNVYYVSRVALGLPIRTTSMGKTATQDDASQKVFPITFRELANVPAVSPPVSYHSLVAEVGGSPGAIASSRVPRRVRVPRVPARVPTLRWSR